MIIVDVATHSFYISSFHVITQIVKVTKYSLAKFLYGANYFLHTDYIKIECSWVIDDGQSENLPGIK